jgi:hypothetical protein
LTIYRALVADGHNQASIGWLDRYYNLKHPEHSTVDEMRFAGLATIVRKERVYTRTIERDGEYYLVLPDETLVGPFGDVVEANRSRDVKAEIVADCRIARLEEETGKMANLHGDWVAVFADGTFVPATDMADVDQKRWHYYSDWQGKIPSKLSYRLIYER